jgi:ribonuclease-3
MNIITDDNAITEVERQEVEGLLGIRVRDLKFYREALLHKSAVKMYNASRSNERLEFIGDAILNMVITKYIYNKFPEENEGFLTKYRMKIVSGKMLSTLAKNLGFQDHIRMNKKAMKQNWNLNDRILEDAFEAIIGAIYLDMGLFHSQTWILEQLKEVVESTEILKDTNYKDMLMRYTQSIPIHLPVYNVSEQTGPDHKKLFTIKVYLEKDGDSVYYGEGTAKIKKQAEQLAAQMALDKLDVFSKISETI